MRRGAPPRDAQYKEVRGLSRGLAVLRALNQMPGGIGPISEIARASGIHRTTVKRLLETLRAEGLVNQKVEDGLYALTFEVRRLAEGFGGSGWIDEIAAPAMFARLRHLLWPSDIATPDAGFMVVRESTHRGSALSQHRAMIGSRVPVLVTALGRAYIGWCPEDEREAMLDLLRARSDRVGDLARDRRYVRRILASTRRRGYATNEGEWLPQADFGAIALPVIAGGRVMASINLVFPRSAVSRPELERRYLPQLAALTREIAEQLERRSAEPRQAAATDPV